MLIFTEGQTVGDIQCAEVTIVDDFTPEGERNFTIGIGSGGGTTRDGNGGGGGSNGGGGGGGDDGGGGGSDGGGGGGGGGGGSDSGGGGGGGGGVRVNANVPSITINIELDIDDRKYYIHVYYSVVI